MGLLGVYADHLVISPLSLALPRCVSLVFSPRSPDPARYYSPVDEGRSDIRLSNLLCLTFLSATTVDIPLCGGSTQLDLAQGTLHVGRRLGSA